MLPPDITDRMPTDVFEQQARNRAKVRNDGGMYAAELEAFERAIEVYDRILGGRRVGNVEVLEDLGSALPPDSGSCNLTRRVRVRTHGQTGPPLEYDAVIKVTGHSVEPGEGVALRRLAPLHAANFTPPQEHRTFSERLKLHFKETIPNLRANHIGTEASLHATLRVLHALGHSANALLLHGDPADVNFYSTSDGAILAFDPRGEIYGAPECDAGSIIAHHLEAFARERGDAVPTAAHVDAIIATVVADAATRDQPLDPDALRAVVGVTMVLWAGYGVPSPGRLTEIEAGARPSDDFAAPEALESARAASRSRYAFGVELVQDFAREQGIEADRSTWAM